MTLKILLPLDGTALSLDQARFAVRLCQNGLQAHFVAANVQEPASFYEVITARDPSRLAQMVIGTAQELVAPAVALLAEAGLSHEVAIAEEGDAVQGMLVAAGLALYSVHWAYEIGNALIQHFTGNALWTVPTGTSGTSASMNIVIQLLWKSQ